MSKYGVILVRIFPYSENRMQENTDQRKLRIWTLFMQCMVYRKANSVKVSCFFFSLILKGTLLKKCLYSEFSWSLFSPNAGEYGPEKLRIPTLFSQWHAKKRFAFNDATKVTPQIFSRGCRRFTQFQLIYYSM